MTQRRFISRFSPNRTAPEDLEMITVQRQGLIDEVVSLERESALRKGKHHLLLVGPRGCGKTHLLALVGSRLGKLDELAERLRIAWLNEDETSTSFLDLLVRIYRALAERYPQEFPHADLEDVYGKDPDQARDLLGASLVRRAGRHTILVMLENLDAMFGQMQVGEQKSWRAFVQNHPIFTTVATAQSLFAGVSGHDQPFFGFFDVRHLKPLTVDEATELLGKIAKLAPEDQDLADFLATPRGRARVRAIHHLAGGNHRLHIVLSEVITKESLEELVGPFEKMVDEQLTPYYQERLRWLAPLQRRIVELLCQRARPMPVKEIAERLFASHSTITPQLKQLREMGYVISTPRGRESLYELKEPLMRLSLQVKGTPQAQPLGLLVDFLRIWYEPDDEWGKAMARWPEALRQEVEPEDGVSYVGLVNAALQEIHSSIGSPLFRKPRAQELVGAFAESGCSQDLGIGLLRSLEVLGSAHLNKQGLEAWLGQWEAASDGHPEMQLPLRLLRVGIDYIASEPKDETLLLQLPQEERRLLRQALGLAE